MPGLLNGRCAMTGIRGPVARAEASDGAPDLSDGNRSTSRAPFSE